MHFNTTLTPLIINYCNKKQSHINIIIKNCSLNDSFVFSWLLKNNVKSIFDETDQIQRSA